MRGCCRFYFCLFFVLFFFFNDVSDILFIFLKFSSRRDLEFSILDFLCLVFYFV